MFEKRWKAIPARAFSADGTTDGTISVASLDDLCDLHVGQVVILRSTTQTSGVQYKVKLVDVDNLQFKVGALKTKLFDYSDVSAYLLSESATFEASEQLRVEIPYLEIFRALFHEEPGVRLRTGLIDKFGRSIDSIVDDDGKIRLLVDPGEIIVTTDPDDPTAQVTLDHVVVTPNSEFSIALPANTKGYQIQVENGASALKFTTTSGESGTQYDKIERGSVFQSPRVNLASSTLYMQTPISGVRVIVTAWYKP